MLPPIQAAALRVSSVRGELPGMTDGRVRSQIRSGKFCQPGERSDVIVGDPLNYTTKTVFRFVGECALLRQLQLFLFYFALNPSCRSRVAGRFSARFRFSRSLFERFLLLMMQKNRGMVALEGVEKKHWIVFKQGMQALVTDPRFFC
jgi:hypothetical protein